MSAAGQYPGTPRRIAVSRSWSRLSKDRPVIAEPSGQLRPQLRQASGSTDWPVRGQLIRESQPFAGSLGARHQLIFMARTYGWGPAAASAVRPVQRAIGHHAIACEVS